MGSDKRGVVCILDMFQICRVPNFDDTFLNGRIIDHTPPSAHDRMKLTDTTGQLSEKKRKLVTEASRELLSERLVPVYKNTQQKLRSFATSGCVSLGTKIVLANICHFTVISGKLVSYIFIIFKNSFRFFFLFLMASCMKNKV